MHRALKLVFWVTSAGLFWASLTQKCFCTTQCGDSILALLTGWLGIAYMDYAALPWLANPAILLAWLFFGKNPLPAMGFSLLSSVLATSFLFVNTIVDNEGGVRRPITKLESGYWLWLSAHLSLLASCSLELFFQKMSSRKATTLK